MFMEVMFINIISYFVIMYIDPIMRGAIFLILGYLLVKAGYKKEMLEMLMTTFFIIGFILMLYGIVTMILGVYDVWDFW